MTESARNRQGDPAAAEQARRALALARVDEKIRKAVEEAPPLSPETRARIRALLPPLPAVAEGEGEVDGSNTISNPTDSSDDTARAAPQRPGDEPAKTQRRVDALAESVQRKVDALPPLTEARCANLAALLRPAGEVAVGRDEEVTVAEIKVDLGAPPYPELYAIARDAEALLEGRNAGQLDLIYQELRRMRGELDRTIRGRGHGEEGETGDGR